jgi:hypothetical protein
VGGGDTDLSSQTAIGTGGIANGTPEIAKARRDDANSTFPFCDLMRFDRNCTHPLLDLRAAASEVTRRP